MKIAFLNIYNGVVNRGAETFIKELASRLSKNNEITVFQSGKPNGDEKYKVEKIPVDWNRSNKNGVGTLRAFLFIDYWNRQIFRFTLKAIPKIWKEKYDVVIPVNGGWMPAIIRIITWLIGSKMIISGQSGIGWDDRNNLWSFPNCFVTLSSRALTWAKKANPFVKVEYIPNGVDIKKFSPQGEILKINLKKPIVLCVGALTKSKRIDLAIKAVAKMGNTSLLIVGDGNLKKEIENFGKKLLGDRFQLIKLPYDKMPEVYRTADIFTIPSESYYSFENVIVEAMATNLPVVVNNDSIRREIIGEAGVLVNPENTEAYAKALEITLSSNWGDKPRKKAEKFDWDKISNSYEKLFLKI